MKKKNRDPENWPFHSTLFQGMIKEGPNSEMLLPPGLFEVLLDKWANYSNMARESQLVKNSINRIFKDSDPIYHPSEFGRLCSDVGAPSIFTWISSLMATTRRKEKRQATLKVSSENLPRYAIARTSE